MYFYNLNPSLKYPRVLQKATTDPRLTNDLPFSSVSKGIEMHRSVGSKLWRTSTKEYQKRRIFPPLEILRVQAE